MKMYKVIVTYKENDTKLYIYFSDYPMAVGSKAIRQNRNGMFVVTVTHCTPWEGPYIKAQHRLVSPFNGGAFSVDDDDSEYKEAYAEVETALTGVADKLQDKTLPVTYRLTGLQKEGFYNAIKAVVEKWKKYATPTDSQTHMSRLIAEREDARLRVMQLLKKVAKEITNENIILCARVKLVESIGMNTPEIKRWRACRQNVSDYKQK